MPVQFRQHSGLNSVFFEGNIEYTYLVTEQEKEFDRLNQHFCIFAFLNQNPKFLCQFICKDYDVIMTS